MKFDTVHAEKFNNQQKDYLEMNLKDNLFQSKQSIDINKCKQPTATLDTFLLDPVGESNPNIQFGYNPQTIYYNTQGKVPG